MGRGPRDQNASSNGGTVSRNKSRNKDTVEKSLGLIASSPLDPKIKIILEQLVEHAGLVVTRASNHWGKAEFGGSENPYRRSLEEKRIVALKEANILESDAYFIEALKTIKTLQEKVANKHALSPEERKSLEKFAQKFFYGKSPPESEDEIIKFPRMINRQYKWYRKYDSYQEAEAYGFGLHHQQKENYDELGELEKEESGPRSVAERIALDHMLLESLQFGVAAGLATDLREVGEEAVGMDIAELEQADLDNLKEKIVNLKLAKQARADQLKRLGRSLKERAFTLNTHGGKVKLRKAHAKNIKDSGIADFMDRINPQFRENLEALL